jgi:hypothetical protein
MTHAQRTGTSLDAPRERLLKDARRGTRPHELAGMPRIATIDAVLAALDEPPTDWEAASGPW